MERSRSEREKENEGMIDFIFVKVFSISKYFHMKREREQ